MSQVSKATAKTYFETDDIPTQAQFEDLIDSAQWYDENSNTTLSGTVWDGSNKTKTLTANTVLTISTTRNSGLLEVKQDATGSRTLTIAGQLLTINTAPNSITLIGFYKNASGEIRLIVELSPIAVGVGDTTAPTIVSATAIDSTHIEVIFSEPVTATTAGWSFKKNGSNLAITSVSGSGTTWTFLVATMAGADTLLRSYNSATGNTLDGSSNELASFTDQSVTNSIGLVALNAPTGLSATPSGSNMVLAWADTNSSPNEVGYEVRRNSTNTTVGATLIHTSAANATGYTDAPGVGTWYYFVRAKGDLTTSNHSSYASASGTIAPSMDSDAQAYITAEETAASIDIDTTNETALSNLISGWKADGLWTDTIQMALGYGTGLINAKSPGTKNLTSATPPTVNANGYLFDGSNDFLNTNIIESVDLPTKENFTIILYIKNASGGTAFGVNDGANGTQFFALSGDFRIQGAGDINMGANPGGTGLYVMTMRNDGTTFTRRVTKNNTQVYNSSAPVDTDKRTAGISLSIGAYNNVGTQSIFFNGTIGGVIIIKRGLSNAEMTSAFNRVDTFITATSRT